MSIPVSAERLSAEGSLKHHLEDRMRYLCLIYEDEKAWESIPTAEAEAVMGEYTAFTDDIRNKGQFVAGEALQPTPTATTVRVRNGKISTTDGPYVETKEQLGGFYLIDAKDLNEAIQIASRIPSARHGSIEVRPVVDFSQEMQKQGQEGATAGA
jgi:hypothetical protein